MKRGILRADTGSPRRPTSRRVSWADIAPAEPRPWGDMPDNALLRISAFLRCRADRVHMASVNRQWHAAVRGPRPPLLPPRPPLPRQLPWLIFPNTQVPVFYSPLTERYHQLCNVPADVRRARLCGSGAAGWVVLALDSRNAYALYNLNSGRRIALPPAFNTPSDTEFPLVVRAATFSAAPSPNNPYMVAAIVLVATRDTAAFWSEGSDTWFTSGRFLTVRPEDVLYYAGAFYFVTAREGVVSFRPAYGANGNVNFQRVDYRMLPRADYGQDIVFMSGMGTMRHYLVESRGRLLMVVRYIYKDDGTEALRVFRFRVMEPVINGQAPPRATWEILDNDLDGRMLFLGPGCSRSFEVAQYDGFQYQDSMIFFVDESFASVRLKNGRRLYSFTDMGRYDMLEMTKQTWPGGRRPARSDNAPPTWWFQ
ncbi:hypothetical protein QOZ80_1BG0072280 [Eleusine coracana subsp. coracana]|nr:hypothetical protein QOZ80_1BG0072280 [Eleusine coracana subsp. coracana]